MGEATRFTVQPRYGSNASVPATLDAPSLITLAPLELITLELTPAGAKPAAVKKS